MQQHPFETGEAITIEQSRRDKMVLSPAQKAAFAGNCIALRHFVAWTLPALLDDESVMLADVSVRTSKGFQPRGQVWLVAAERGGGVGLLRARPRERQGRDHEQQRRDGESSVFHRRSPEPGRRPGRSWDLIPRPAAAGPRRLANMSTDDKAPTAAADDVKRKFKEALEEISNPPSVLILKLTHVPFIDSTGVHALTEALKLFRRSGTKFIFCGVQPQVMSRLQHGGIVEAVGRENFHGGLKSAVARAHALS